MWRGMSTSSSDQGPVHMMTPLRALMRVFFLSEHATPTTRPFSSRTSSARGVSVSTVPPALSMAGKSFCVSSPAVAEMYLPWP